MTHWTERNYDDFVYRIVAYFLLQLRNRMEYIYMKKENLSKKLGVTTGQVNKILNNPGSISLKTAIKFARALDMKVALVAYGDGDSGNKEGPIEAEIFEECWIRIGKPKTFFDLEDKLGD